MPIFEFECSKCHTIFEKITQYTVKYAFCPNCHHAGKKVMSVPHVANYKSGFKQTPFLSEQETELNFKKEDVFGRKYSELPEENELESRFHGEVETFEQETKQKAPLEKKLNIMEKVWGKKRLKEKWKTAN